MRFEQATAPFVTAFILSSCSVEAPSPALAPSGTPDPTTESSTFVGTYDVPVPPTLTAAAAYPVREIRWSAAGGVARLSYDLPLDLVGKTIGLSFEGPIDPGAATVTLTGNAGTADCAIGADDVVCHETMTGLSPLAPDYSEIAALATSDYTGPSSDRIDVAQRFAGDPIGVVHVDLASPAANGGGPDSH